MSKISLSNLSSRQILGTRVDGTTYSDACDRILSWVKAQQSCYIVAANVHVVMTGYWHRPFQQIINQAALVTPDGMPLVIGLRLLGIKHQSRVYGPDLMLAWCDRAAQLGLSIYLYGGTESMLEKLCQTLKHRCPGLLIAGYHAPPFRSLSAAEEIEDSQRIQRSEAAVVFVGLGCPKQEDWMARQQGRLTAVMIGVGAAFAFISEEMPQAPRWMMAWGLEWLYRFAAEPGRLWKRYLINNPAFLVLFGWQLLQYRFRKKAT